jgi:hypothetical protein
MLRVGGGMVMAGTVGWLAFSRLRGALPGHGQALIATIEPPAWRLVHICTILAIVVLASGVALLSGTLMSAWSAALGHAGAMIAVPAAAVLGVGFAVEGFVLGALSNAYAATSDEAARQMHVVQADLVLQVIGATSFAYQTLFGLAIAILSVATWLSREYPPWHCWLGMFGGAWWAIAGILIFLDIPKAGFWLVDIPVVPVAIWLLGFGWLAWRKADERTIESPMATAKGAASPAP